MLAHAGERDENGRHLVVRNGSHQPPEVLTRAGAIKVTVRDKVSKAGNVSCAPAAACTTSASAAPTPMPGSICRAEKLSPVSEPRAQRRRGRGMESLDEKDLEDHHQLCVTGSPHTPMMRVFAGCAGGERGPHECHMTETGQDAKYWAVSVSREYCQLSRDGNVPVILKCPNRDHTAFWGPPVTRRGNALYRVPRVEEAGESACQSCDQLTRSSVGRAGACCRRRISHRHTGHWRLDEAGKFNCERRADHVDRDRPACPGHGHRVRHRRRGIPGIRARRTGATPRPALQKHSSRHRHAALLP